MLNVFVNTWKNYNENGADGGQWITLPMDADELEETLEEIYTKMGDFDAEPFINDYEWVTDWDGFDISEHESITELNELLNELDGLCESDQEVYAAAVEYWGREYVNPWDVDDYRLYSYIQNEYDLGYYWIEESGCYDLDKLGNLAHYIDYERFGRDVAIEADGGFTSYGFIERI